MTPNEAEEFRHHGFFSSYTETSRHKLRESVTEWFDFVSKLNEFGQSVLPRCEVRNGDLVHLFALAIVTRALTTFQAAFLLAERGIDCGQIRADPRVECQCRFFLTSRG